MPLPPYQRNDTPSENETSAATLCDPVKKMCQQLRRKSFCKQLVLCFILVSRSVLCTDLDEYDDNVIGHPVLGCTCQPDLMPNAFRQTNQVSLDDHDDANDHNDAHEDYLH